MKHLKTIGRAVRDSMLLAWLLVGAFTIALLFSVRAGLTLRTMTSLLLAAPLVVHTWARGMVRLENKANRSG